MSRHGMYKTFFVPFDTTKLNLNIIKDTVKNRASSSDKNKKSKEKFVAPICGKISLPKESINTKKVTNGCWKAHILLRLV